MFSVIVSSSISIITVSGLAGSVGGVVGETFEEGEAIVGGIVKQA